MDPPCSLPLTLSYSLSFYLSFFKLSYSLAFLLSLLSPLLSSWPWLAPRSFHLFSFSLPFHNIALKRSLFIKAHCVYSHLCRNLSQFIPLSHNSRATGCHPGVPSWGLPLVYTQLSGLDSQPGLSGKHLAVLPPLPAQSIGGALAGRGLSSLSPLSQAPF